MGSELLKLEKKPSSILTSHFPISNSHFKLPLQMTPVSSLFSQGCPTKSEFDNRDYKALTLPNGLRALVIHEEGLDKSCASLNVHVGSFQDPREAQGIAHFLEHLLFMGTATYPKENEYSQFLSAHGGDYNAFTDSEFTNYYFNIPSEHLEKTLDMFSSFFTCPLFSASATEREMLAVDSEHKKNIEQDPWRIYQLDKSAAKSEHPFSRFGTGDCSTLCVPSIRDKVVEFWNTYYSSHLMTLVVYGSAPIETLVQLVVDKFSLVPRTKADLNELYPQKDLPYDQSALGVITYVKPIKDLKTLTLSWQLPSVVGLFDRKPLECAMHLLGHEGEGSILNELKVQGLATGLTSEVEKFSSFSRFHLTVDLTASGEAQWERVAEVVFGYLKMLQGNKPVPAWIMQEWGEISQCNFTFKEKSVPSSYALKLTENMHRFPIEHVLDGDYWLGAVDVELIQSFIDLFTVESVRIMLVAGADSDFKAKRPHLPLLKEKHYGTEFQTESISAECLSQFRDAPILEGMKFPLKNQFIPKDFTLKAPIVPYDQRLKAPQELISNTCLWHKTDDTFGLPKANVFLLLQCPSLTSKTTLHNYVSMELLLECWKLQNAAKYYSPSLAGLSFKANLSVEGINLKIYGFNDKILSFAQMIITDLITFVPKESSVIFDAAKESLFRAYKNMENDSPYQLAAYWMTCHLQRPSFSYLEKAQTVQGIDFLSFVSFCCMQKEFTLKGLVHGNLDAQETLQAYEDWTCLLQCTTKAPTAPAINCTELAPNQPLKLFKRVPNTNNAIELFYQCLPFSDGKRRVLVQLYAQVFGDEFFNQLRTIDQIGYVCVLRVRDSYSLIGVRFLVQSAVKGCQWIESRIQDFIAFSKQSLSGAHLTPTEWRSHCEALKSTLLERKKNLFEESEAYWAQIVNGQCDFARAETEAALVDGCSMEQLERFIAEYLVEGGAEWRKASLWIAGNECSEEELLVDEGRIFIQK